jgi:hypothetical protein
MQVFTKKEIINKMLKLLKSGLVTCLFVTTGYISNSFAGELYTSFPTKINADEKYVFYSHGYIVEGDNETPVSSRWGMYDFPLIKKTLSDEKYNLIAYHRPKDTNPRTFAKKLALDIKTLVKSGVQYKNISLVGFSRGGAITVLTSNEVKSDEMNIIILAGCGSFVTNNQEVKAYGNVYSIYETSDGVGSCQHLIDRSVHVKHFEEIAISTGKEHGAFYTPIPEWSIPVKRWIK